MLYFIVDDKHEFLNKGILSILNNNNISNNQIIVSHHSSITKTPYLDSDPNILTCNHETIGVN